MAAKIRWEIDFACETAFQIMKRKNALNSILYLPLVVSYGYTSTANKMEKANIFAVESSCEEFLPQFARLLNFWDDLEKLAASHFVQFEFHLQLFTA